MSNITILPEYDPALEAKLTGATPDERWEQLQAMVAEHQAARQKLEDERRKLWDPARHGDARAARRHNDLVDQIEVMAARGYVLTRMQDRLQGEMRTQRENERMNRLFTR